LPHARRGWRTGKSGSNAMDPASLQRGRVHCISTFADTPQIRGHTTAKRRFTSCRSGVGVGKSFREDKGRADEARPGMMHDALRVYRLRSHKARVVASRCADGTMSIAASARKERTDSRRASHWALRVASRAVCRAANHVLNCAYRLFASVARPTPMCMPQVVVCPCVAIVISFGCVLLDCFGCGLLNRPLGRKYRLHHSTVQRRDVMEAMNLLHQ